MPLNGDVELQQILSELGKSSEGVVGVEIVAFKDGSSKLLEFRYSEVGLNTLVDQEFSLSDSAAQRIATAFGNYYGLDLALVNRLMIQVYRGKIVKVIAEYNTPEDLSTVDWGAIFAP
jgi:hypothetical protein